MGVSDLSTELWRQRELLEQLLFKFEEERLLLVAGRSRWIPHATREVETVVARLSASSLALSMAMADTAAEWGLSTEARLRDVVAAAPTGAWSDVLSAHLHALGTLTDEVKSIQADNTRLLRTALRSAHETLNLITDPSEAYAADGSPAASTPPARLVDARL